MHETPTLSHPPDLHTCRPCVGVGVGPGAFKAHVVLDHILDHKGLLQDGSVKDLGLDSQLDLQALGVGLSPNEAGINKLDLGR